MKDLHINQKSIINGVKRLIRGLCRESSRVKNTNHILMCRNITVTLAMQSNSYMNRIRTIFCQSFIHISIKRNVRYLSTNNFLDIVIL